MAGLRIKYVHVPATLVALAAIAPLSGCASSEPRASSHGSTGGDASTPTFSGPWADEFLSAFRASKSEFERNVLADGVVTDGEFSEMQDRFAKCLTAHDIQFKGFNAAGGYDFDFGERMSAAEANAAADTCSASSGLDTVGSLFFAMHRNPKNVDEATLMADCLVRKKMVPKGYTAGDYTRDAPEMSFPFTSKDSGIEALNACSTDPLGTLTGGAMG